jgi:hypothetical protein
MWGRVIEEITSRLRYKEVVSNCRPTGKKGQYLYPKPEIEPDMGTLVDASPG